MTASRPLEVRELVQQQFSEMNASSGTICGEAVLVRGGQYCGHRFLGTGISAVWFLEEDQIKFYDNAGSVLKVMSTLRPSVCLPDTIAPSAAPPLRRAA